MKVLVIDNYDSFVHNLIHLLEELKCEVSIFKNDEIEFSTVEYFDKILLSPGPGIPSEAGKLKSIIEKFSPTKNILGVCLGHQAIGEVFGGKLIKLNTIFHGVSSLVTQTQKDAIFKGLPAEFQVGRYHSWTIENTENTPLEVTSVDEQGNIMSIRHKHYNVRGVQYHPESILTPFGKTIIENWINL